MSNAAAGAIVELHPNPSPSGDVAGLKATPPWRTRPVSGECPIFPPRDRAIVQAIAREAVSQAQLPLSRLSSADLASRASTALGKAIGPGTVWRILDADAIKPWRYEYWTFPRDPHFAGRAGRVLDFYAGSWEDEPLGRMGHIIGSDEKTSIPGRHTAGRGGSGVSHGPGGRRPSKNFPGRSETI